MRDKAAVSALKAAASQALPEGIGAKPTPTSPEWSRAMSASETLVSPALGTQRIKPSDLLGNDLALLTEHVRRLLGTGHPVLATIANYYFSAGGKHVRPMVVLLVSQATSVAPKREGYDAAAERARLHDGDVDVPVSSMDREVRFDEAKTKTIRPSDISSLPDNNILSTQRRLAEISEMIHTASLLHDDVIDLAMTRRSTPSANAEFGNKMAILAGDFLLARASVALARLRNVEVVELLATVISNLVEGEFMQLRNSALNSSKQEKGTSWFHRHIRDPLFPAPSSTNSTSQQTPEQQEILAQKFDYYLEKTYLKTASLIAKSCRAAAVLGGCTPHVVDACYAYGKNLGIAFQLVDDMLDFTTSADAFGKPVNADLKLGLATAPVLFAAETYGELHVLMERNFAEKGDVEKALELVFQSDGLPRTHALAASYCQKAIDAISLLPDTPARSALIQLTDAVLTRKK
ncbi:isoprenoid synthase domain-containing protein [Fimicolochytrium jonesii]|uniref:isoprenoid synthase domain-containing protein n=1 Tax=Fimicolochytrium jonesii TaxID=1396493 RepID=UPI0022FEA88A|nr:isoprenoid synthase domain-containing protein [Fimicolochytrium jonesii]KAI8819101.1 isoprenoid synthase domain-containing protein [Fimicolochytrium jonesii]